MSFENTKAGLSYLESCGQDISLVHFFDTFHNFCEEAEEAAGSKLEKISLKNVSEEDLVASILKCTKKIVRVINKNKDNISDSGNVELLAKEVSRLNKNIEVLQEQNKQAQHKLEEKEGLIEQEQNLQKQLLQTEQSLVEKWKEHELQLKAAKKKLDDTLCEKKALISECGQLETSINRFENVNLPKLYNRKQELLRQEEEVKNRISARKKDLADMDAAILKLKQEKDGWDADKILKNADLQAAKQQHEKAKQELLEIKNQIAELEKDIKNKQTDYQIEQAGLEKLGGKQRELIDMIRQLREDQSELNIDILTFRKEQEKMEYERKKREYDEQKRKLDEEQERRLEEYQAEEAKIEAKKQSQLEIIKNQEQSLKERKAIANQEIQIQLYAIQAKEKDDNAEIQRKLDAVEAKKVERLAEYQAKIDSIARAEAEAVEIIQKKQNAVQERINAKDSKIAEEKKKQQDLEEKFTEQSVELTKAMQETEDKIRSTKLAVIALKNKRQELNDDLDAAYKEQDKLDKWFKSIEAETNSNSLARLQGQITALKTAKRNLDAAFGNKYFMDGDVLEKQLEEYSTYFKQTLKEVEEKLGEYCKRYAMVSEVIYKGGNE